MIRLLMVVLCVLPFMLSGCTHMVALDASDKADTTLKADYARYIIEKQANGTKDTPSFDKWLTTGEYKNLSDYGTYYDLCKRYPELNKGGPLNYNDWVTAKPRPIAKDGWYLFE